MFPDSHITILILAANPRDTVSLRLDEELRRVLANLRHAAYAERMRPELLLATRADDAWGAILQRKPRIVHFAGHGEGVDGLVLENEDGEAEPVSTQALQELFKIFAPEVECVLLNACDSHVQARAIAAHIPVVIGVRGRIPDTAAGVFSAAFYQALGNGETYRRAFDFARSRVTDRIGDVELELNLREDAAAWGLFREAAPSEVENTANDLVYFLADRGEQEARLRKALHTWDGNRPFLCLTYGRHPILQERFVERVVNYFFHDHSLAHLSQPLNDIGNGRPLCPRYPVKKPEQLHAELDDLLGLRHIANQISHDNQRRAVLHFDFNSGEWFGNGRRNTVTEFIVYWQHADLLREAAHAPLIFLSFQCLPEHLAWWPASRAAAARRWFQHRAQLDPPGFRQAFGLPGVILPELRAIDCADAERWAGLDKVRACYPHIPTWQLQRRISERLYPTRKELLAMGDLGARLHEEVILSFSKGIS